MLTDLSDDQLALAELMSRISEAGYSAAWMAGLEIDLWTAVNGGSKRYGQYIITQDEIHQLQSLASKCACWIVFDEKGEETPVDLMAWREIYAQRAI